MLGGGGTDHTMVAAGRTPKKNNLVGMVGMDGSGTEH
jgi:hypothetical protein